jgi:hypothetical protein
MGVFLAVFMTRLHLHAEKRGYDLLDTMAAALGELLAIGLLGVCLGWVIKQIRSLWQRRRATPKQPH